jgi:fructokinase
VLVTDGGAAVDVVTSTDRRRLPVPRVDVVDSVGAGDAFGGGFLATWVLAGRGRGQLSDAALVDDTVRTAIEVAAMTCQRAGADPPTRAELDARLVRG